jgi:hypothetical protein
MEIGSFCSDEKQDSFYESAACSLVSCSLCHRLTAIYSLQLTLQLHYQPMFFQHVYVYVYVMV